jgi:uncharacterized membrane protein
MLTIYNLYNEPVEFCTGLYNEDACESVSPDNPWMISGWYLLEPGTGGVVSQADLAYPYFLVYGQSTQSGATWSGSVSVPVSMDGFERCWGTPASGDELRNFAPVNVGNNVDFTLNLQ